MDIVRAFRDAMLRIAPQHEENLPMVNGKFPHLRSARERVSKDAVSLWAAILSRDILRRRDAGDPMRLERGQDLGREAADLVQEHGHAASRPDSC